MLEELKEAYGKDYSVQAIALPKGVQKQPWYLEQNCNGKIPTIVDHDQGGVSVGEGAGKLDDSHHLFPCLTLPLAVLQYLARNNDPDVKFHFTGVADIAKCEQWVAFSQGDLTPMGANCVRYYRFLPVKHNFPLATFHREILRQFDVLNKALKNREYLVGEGKGKYSIADVSVFPFVNSSYFIGVGSLEKWPDLKKWQERIWARPAVKKGVDVPYPVLTTNELLERKLKEDEGWRKSEEALRETLEKALKEVPDMPGGPPPGVGKKP